MARPRSRNGAPPAGPAPVITASEIGEYGYCARAWWYRHVIKLPTTGDAGRFASGTRAHRSHSRWVRSSVQLRSAALLLVLLGLALLVVALVLTR